MSAPGEPTPRAFLVTGPDEDFDIFDTESADEARAAFVELYSPACEAGAITVAPLPVVKVTVELWIAVRGEPSTAGDVVDNLLENGVLQDAINEHDGESPDAHFSVLSAVTAAVETLSTEEESSP